MRETLGRFAELVKSPEHIHTYRITSLSLWNAAALGMTAGEIKTFLAAHSKYPLPGNVVSEIEHVTARYGKIELHPSESAGTLVLKVLDPAIAGQVAVHPKAAHILSATGTPGEFALPAVHRGTIKQVLTKIGYPIVDLAGFIEGDERSLGLRAETLSGSHTFTLSKNSIAGAMDAGLSPANIIDFLRDHSKTGVPDSVLRLLGDLGKKHGQVKVGFASTFLTVTDLHVVREILANKAFQRMSPKAVGERAVILSEPNPQKVLGLLQKMGHYPVMEEDEREDLGWN